MSPPPRLPALGQLVSAMLSAEVHRVHAHGAGVEAGTPSSEEYWQHGALARLVTPGRTVTTGPAGSRVAVRGSRVETGPPLRDWLGWTDRLLRPELLAVWGRPGEDWRLGDVEARSRDVPGCVLLSLEHVEDNRRGEAHVDPHTGRVLLLELPGSLRWQLTEVDEDPDVASWPVGRWFAGVRATGS